MIKTTVTVTVTPGKVSLEKIFARLGVYTGKSGAAYVSTKQFPADTDGGCYNAPGEADQPTTGMLGVVDVGYFGTAAPGGGPRRRGRKGKDGQRHAEQLNDATKALYAEFGTVRQPPRPLFQHTAQENRHYKALLGWHAIQIFQGAPGALATRLKQIGHVVKENLEMGIALSTEWAEPNRKFTVDKKGFNHPLFEHGHMIDAIKVKVNTAGDRGNP